MINQHRFSDSVPLATRYHLDQCWPNSMMQKLHCFVTDFFVVGFQLLGANRMICYDGSPELYTRHNLEHSEAETKWLPFCRRHFKIDFLVWKLLNFDLNFTEIYSKGSNQQQAFTFSNNGLAPRRWQAIIWNQWWHNVLVHKCVTHLQWVKRAKRCWIAPLCLYTVFALLNRIKHARHYHKHTSFKTLYRHWFFQRWLVWYMNDMITYKLYGANFTEIFYYKYQ